jgi:hypothetical protein
MRASAEIAAITLGAAAVLFVLFVAIHAVAIPLYVRLTM